MEVAGTVTIVGDIHGNYFDFLKILTKIGDLDEASTGSVLFLGDYVDRGVNSVEVITFIMALKINYPQAIILLRGNHESRCMTITYNFMKEVLLKYNQTTYERFMVAFDALPLVCLVNKHFFCVHGGISDKMMNVRRPYPDSGNQKNRENEGGATGGTLLRLCVG
jgi:serine/threonine-protein phosphatase 2B catalytic subunit